MALTGTTPSFSDPPVVEVAMGVEFTPLDPFGYSALAHWGDFFSEGWPVREEVPAIIASVEPGSPIQFVGGLPPARLWLSRVGDGRLLQLQYDRFILNWRKEFDSKTYPRYTALRGEYIEYWESAIRGLSQLGWPEVEPATVEFSYVNLVRLNADESLGDVLTLFARGSNALPGRIVDQRFRSVRRIEADVADGLNPAELTIASDPIEGEGGTAIRLAVTARVFLLSGGAREQVWAALDHAHHLSASTFAAMTKHEEWGRQG